jgi:hypothetical protein
MRRIRTQEELESIVSANWDEISQRIQAIHKYDITVKSSVMDRQVVLGDLQGRFIQMKSCIHRESDNDRVIDINALVYALQRLPEIATLTHKVYVLKEPKITESSGIIEVNSQVKRRAYYDVGGELFTVARDGDTDILDFVNCLESYSREAQKIKAKLQNGKFISREDFLHADTPEKKNRIYAKLAGFFGGVDAEKIKKADESLGGRLLALIPNMMVHEPANIVINFDPDFAVTNNSTKARLWSKAIEQELSKYSGRPIALISSDTHTLVNCLTGFARNSQDAILKIANANTKIAESLKDADVNNPSVLYCLLQQVTRTPEGRDLFKQKIAYEESLGMRFIKDRFDTNVDVQIIDIPELMRKLPKNIDPRLKFDQKRLIDSGLLILNMDYSFGMQGYHNMMGLCERLGRDIKSISIMGKAGITRINGGRFEIMLPDFVIEQSDAPNLHDFPNGNRLTMEDIRAVSFDGQIHDGGPMLTVPGTAMQSDIVLYHFMCGYDALGVEMEAGPYVKAIKNSYRKRRIGENVKILNKDIRMDVGYWASDDPTNPNETLAQNHMVRGAIPSYALALAIQNNIFRSASSNWSR